MVKKIDKEEDINKKTETNKKAEKKKIKIGQKKEGWVIDWKTISVIDSNKRDKKGKQKTKTKIKEKEKDNVGDSWIIDDKEKLDILFIAVQGWTIIALTLFALELIFLTGSLWGLFIVLMIGLSLYSIKEYKKINDREKKITIIALTILSLLLVSIAPLTLSAQKNFIRLQGNVISFMSQKNIKLKQELNSTVDQMVKINKDYKKDIIQLKKEKLSYGEIVKNKTINMIINNLRNMENQNISNIDISQKTGQNEK